MNVSESLISVFLECVGRVPQSVYRQSYGMVGPGLNLSGVESSACPDWPRGPSSLLKNGYRVFTRGKLWQRHSADHLPPSSAMLMEEWSHNSVTGSLYFIPRMYHREMAGM